MTTELEDDILAKAGVRLLMKREDLNHPLISGNKWWKLRYNLEAALKTGHETVLTYGGAYSNHICATAAAAHEAGLKSIGVIRGEEERALNHVLEFAELQGMKLHFVSREAYTNKDNVTAVESLHGLFGDFFRIPEGGSNVLAVRGCVDFAETLKALSFDVVCLPVGTGGTLAGLAAGIASDRKLIGFSVLKNGGFLSDSVADLLKAFNGLSYSNFRIETAYHFGGYAKKDNALIRFMEGFESRHGIPLEPVYTGKMMFGLYDMIAKGEFARDTTILAIHTGGLQSFKIS